MRSVKIMMAALLMAALGGPSQAGNLAQADPFEGAQFAQVKKAKKAMASPAGGSSLFDNGGMWLSLYSGLDFSFMGDIGKSAQSLVDTYEDTPGVTTEGGNNNLGVQGGVLLGFRLDQVNSLALNLGSVLNFGVRGYVTDGVDEAEANFSPILLGATLDYILEVAKSQGSRTYLTAGAGWYHAILGYDFEYIGMGFNGTFSGDTFGGTLGFGQQFSMGDSVALDLSLRGRFANIGKLSAKEFEVTGGPPPPEDTYYLAIGDIIYEDMIVPATADSIESSGGAADYASLDFSGIDAQVALTFFFN